MFRHTILFLFITLFGYTAFAQKDIPKEMVFSYVEQMPKYKENVNEYLARNIVYPLKARQNGIQGQVIIGFIVNADSTLSEFKVYRGIGDGCDEEALRVIKGMGKWIPGKQSGHTVPVRFTLPILFKLNDPVDSKK